MTVENIMAIAAGVVPFASVLASPINQSIREAQEQGSHVSPSLLILGRVLNALALNADKVKQLGNIANGQKLDSDFDAFVKRLDALDERLSALEARFSEAV